MNERNSEFGKIWARVVAKAWIDEDYKRRLLEDATAVARDEGVPIPEGIKLKVIEELPGTTTLVLPPPPDDLGSIGNAEQRLAAWCYCDWTCGGT